MKADVDGNGTLDYGEFVAVIIHLQRLSNDEHLRRAFVFFDKDGSNYIELDELSEALADESGQTDIDVLNDIIREVDTDKVCVYPFLQICVHPDMLAQNPELRFLHCALGWPNQL